MAFTELLISKTLNDTNSITDYSLFKNTTNKKITFYIYSIDHTSFYRPSYAQASVLDARIFIKYNNNTKKTIFYSKSDKYIEYSNGNKYVLEPNEQLMCDLQCSRPSNQNSILLVCGYI